MAARTRKRTRRRPGHPRKSNVLNRITLRVDEELYDWLNTACEERNATQRDIVEEALREELGRPVDAPAEGAAAGPLRRTGMWIDPSLVAEMDLRLEKEGPRSTQRGFIERALRNMRARQAQPG